MSFSKQWNDRYRENTHMSIWPWSDLVSYVMRYARPKNPEICNVLELGCGAGANVKFFRWLGVNYCAVDGSSIIINRLKNQFPEFADNIRVADFTRRIPFNRIFDIVVDRASLTHNDTKSISSTLAIVKTKMKSGGIFIGIDWFSTKHSDYNIGVLSDDGFTCSNFTSGQFKNVGKVHFSNTEHIIDLFKDFEIQICEEKYITRQIPKGNQKFASFNFVAIKK